MALAVRTATGLLMDEPKKGAKAPFFYLPEFYNQMQHFADKPATYKVRLAEFSVATLLLLASLPLSAVQQPTGAADSASAHETAVAEQRQFEQIKRQALPFGDPGSGRCQLNIGRYCLRGFSWGDDEEWQRGEEAPVITEARNRLIATLDSVGRLHPGNLWINRQLVRYLVEQDSSTLAVSQSRNCEPAQTWECESLLGYALFRAGEIEESNAEFSKALAHMPDSIRCEWTDLGAVLDRTIRRSYSRKTCEERQQDNRRILWLADPLWITPANELTAEHFSRRVFIEMLKDSEATDGNNFRRDIETITVKFGWPVASERIAGGGPSSLFPEIVNRYGRGARYFLPSLDIFDDPTKTQEDDWDLTPHGAPEAGHTPFQAARGLYSLSHKTFVFKRENEALLFSEISFDNDSIADTTTVRFAIIAQENENSRPQTTARTVTGPGGTLTLAVPLAPHLISIEAVATGLERAARIRFGVDPSARLLSDAGDTQLSDLILTVADDSLPRNLQAAIEEMLPNDTVFSGDRI
ncbi:MAG: hypothetical protein OEZ54_11270, partial [Gemmatimonadota bacterium]|nr:hypothetical protein [Gemmatimonadota bacterium]